MYATLLTSLENGILTITINRPDKLNALNKQVFADLNKVLDEIYTHAAIQAVIITGAGTKAFVAGADIGEFEGLDTESAIALSKAGQESFFRIERCPKPIIACVNGFALGGGCELAMSCHFRLASEHAKFGQPEVNLGLIPGYGGTQRLAQLVGKGRAMELLMSAVMIDAPTALQYGLVNYVVPAEELLPKARTLLETILTKAPLAIGKCIESINACYEPGVDGYEREAAAFGYCFQTADRIEGTRAFLEKRKAVFQGK
ncbi:MAG TPA: enoyl-CoA hydratase-related protein [Sediminibacterium sp.]|nr:enoyl-CoA hydratase-related protein [Sediminibacterium sp.]